MRRVPRRALFPTKRIASFPQSNFREFVGGLLRYRVRILVRGDVDIGDMAGGAGRDSRYNQQADGFRAAVLIEVFVVGDEPALDRGEGLLRLRVDAPFQRVMHRVERCEALAERRLPFRMHPVEADRNGCAQVVLADDDGVTGYAPAIEGRGDLVAGDLHALELLAALGRDGGIYRPRYSAARPRMTWRQPRSMQT